MKARNEKSRQTDSRKKPRGSPRPARQARPRAQPSEQVLRGVLDALSQGVCVHRDYQPLYVNRAFARIHGYDEPGDILALGSILKLMPADRHALSRERVARRMAGTSAPARFHEAQLRKDGTHIVVEKTVSVVDWEGAPALLISLSEVTEVAEIASALGQSERRFQDFAEVASDWYWETDREHRFTYFSSRFHEVTGVSQESRIGKRRTEIALKPFGPDPWPQHLADLEARRPFRNLVYAYLDGDGVKRHVRVSGKPVFADNGEWLGYRGTGTDITAELQALEQAAREHRQLVDAVSVIPAAFYVFGEDERLELVNERARQLYPRNSPVRTLGSRYEEIMRWSVENGELLTTGNDREAWIQARMKQFRDPPDSFEFQLADGRWIKGLDRKTADGGTVSIRFEITAEKRRMEALRASREALENHRRLLQAVLDALPLWVFVKDQNSRYILVNRKLAEDQGFPQEAYPGLGIDRAPVEDSGARRAFREGDEKVLRSGETVDVAEEHIPLPGGHVSVRHTIKIPLRDAAGRITGIVGVSEEINARKGAERALRESEERYRGLVEASLQGMAIIRDGRFVFANLAEARILGLESPGEMVGRSVLEFMPASVHEELRARWERALRGEPLPEIEHEILGADGALRWIRGIASMIDYGGSGAILGIHADITESKQARQELRVSEERFRNLIEGSIQGILIHRDNRPVFINAAYARMFGYGSPEELMRLESLDHLIAEEDRLRVTSYYHFRLRGEPVPDRYAFKGVRKDGSPIWIETLARVIDWDGAPAVQGTYIDITEQQEAVARLRASEERFRNLVEGSIQGVIVHRNLAPLFINEAFARIFGYDSAAELMAMPSMKVVVAPADQERLFAYQRSRLEGGEAPANYQFEGARKDGTRVWVDAISRVVSWDGKPAVQTAMYDITRRKVLEEELRQSQKMEAIGKLAGGIAHDFNNLLQVISGFARLALADVAESEPLYRDLDMIQGAAERAAGLTRQLLAFSRRQVLNPTELNLRELTQNLVKMIERLIERHITVTVESPGADPVVVADPGMIEQVLMNLCVNARDAMPAGGTLKIETFRADLGEEDCRGLPWAKPGRYGVISVSDTGTGITPEVREHIFDPFFTTKEFGKGTGLGLSTVFGIVQQHNGFLIVDSAPGKGSMFRVYLPAAEGPAYAAGADTAEAAPGGSETVLVVEDEPGVQHVALRALSRAGYRVLTASNGAEAIDVLSANAERVRLVLLDLIMPGMTGVEVHTHIRRVHPAVRILVATGYSSRLPESGGEGIGEILHKPYSPEQLMKAVRRTLDAP